MPRRSVSYPGQKAERERSRAARQAVKAQRRAERRMEKCAGHPVDTDPSVGMEPYSVEDPRRVVGTNAFPEATEAYQGIARALSRGL